MKVNVILVLDQNEENILMCLRAKDPYKGKFNLVGGKVEKGENGLHAAYRELFEETGISKDDISLTHLMDYTYLLDNTQMEVYTGKLKNEVDLIEEVNKLFWVDIKSNFFDMEKYAGEGNIGHILEIAKYYKKECLQ